MWEANFMHIHNWEGECSYLNPGLLDFSLKNSDFFYDYTNADHARAVYKTGFESAEFNYWRFVSWKKDDYVSVSWTAGLRYFFIPEEVRVAYEKGGDKSSGEIEVTNHIGALQAGGSIQWNPARWLSWDLFLKGGGGYGWAHLKNHFRDYNNTVTLFNFEVDGYSWPFFVDLGLILDWQIANWFNLHAGYQMIYLNAFTTAPDQLVKHPHPDHHINPNGATIVYGLSGGLTFSF